MEIILIDDGSRDQSWSTIETLCRKNVEVRGIKLSRNFGQHQAISAGLAEARGDYVFVLDSDLQDDPAFMPDLFEQARAGFDIVLTHKKKRAHAHFKNFCAAAYYRLFNWLADNNPAIGHKAVGAYSLPSRKVVDAFNRMQDYHRHYLFILHWLGFEPAYVEIEHRPRPHGKSSYTFFKLVKHAVNGITSQSDKLLYLSINMGLLFFVSSLSLGCYLVIRYFVSGFKEGWTSIMVMLLLSTGLILLSLGIAGIYLGKAFEQAKNRPLYIVDKELNASPSAELTESKARKEVLVG